MNGVEYAITDLSVAVVSEVSPMMRPSQNVRIELSIGEETLPRFSNGVPPNQNPETRHSQIYNSARNVTSPRHISFCNLGMCGSKYMPRHRAKGSALARFS
jgi:hypothetical protein